jgi:hypothetical protein
MPYIPPQQRERLDERIEGLAQSVNALAAEVGSYEGILNYVVTELVLKVMPERRYKHIARVTGVLQNVSQEFYRRLAAPYEDEAAATHGDVYHQP